MPSRVLCVESSSVFNRSTPVRVDTFDEENVVQGGKWPLHSGHGRPLHRK